MNLNGSEERFSYERAATSEDGLLEVDFEKEHSSAKKWCGIGQFRSSILAHAITLSVYTLVFLLALEHFAKRYEHGPDLIYTPVRDAVKYEKRFLDYKVHSESAFKGPPSPETDTAWHELFVYNNLRITKEELDKMNRTSVQLSDGSGDYLATVDVYHHLHCLKLIRQYIHPEYYPEPQSSVPIADHVDHCIDAIRQELMCRAETTFTTYEWIPNLRIPWATLAYEHECVNFEAIHAWVKTRAFDIRDPKYLIHPTLGTSFPLGSL